MSTLTKVHHKGSVSESEFQLQRELLGARETSTNAGEDFAELSTASTQSAARRSLHASTRVGAGHGISLSRARLEAESDSTAFTRGGRLQGAEYKRGLGGDRATDRIGASARKAGVGVARDLSQQPLRGAGGARVAEGRRVATPIPRSKHPAVSDREGNSSASEARASRSERAGHTRGLDSGRMVRIGASAQRAHVVSSDGESERARSRRVRQEERLAERAERRAGNRRTVAAIPPAPRREREDQAEAAAPGAGAGILNTLYENRNGLAKAMAILGSGAVAYKYRGEIKGALEGAIKYTTRHKRVVLPEGGFDETTVRNLTWGTAVAAGGLALANDGSSDKEGAGEKS